MKEVLFMDRSRRFFSILSEPAAVRFITRLLATLAAFEMLEVFFGCSFSLRLPLLLLLSALLLVCGSVSAFSASCRRTLRQTVLRVLLLCRPYAVCLSAFYETEQRRRYRRPGKHAVRRRCFPADRLTHSGRSRYSFTGGSCGSLSKENPC